MSLTGDALTDRMVPIAVRLVGAVREFNADEVAAALAEAEALALDCQAPVSAAETLAVVLAAMVPWDRTPGELLAWWRYRDEFRRLVAAGVEPAVAAEIISHTAHREGGE